MSSFTTFKERNMQIDCMKGIAIILVVVGHCNLPVRSFIYLFHMPFFFIISGALWKPINSSSLKQVFSYFLRKIRNLYLPFMIFNNIWVLLNNSFVNIGFYDKSRMMTSQEILREVVRNILFIGTSQMGGPYWFLRVLFILSMLFCVFDYIFKKIPLPNAESIGHLCISIILLLVGYFFQKNTWSYHGIEIAFSLYFCYYIGTKISYLTHKTLSIIGDVIICLFCGGLELFFTNFGTHEISCNQYKDPIFLIITSICGFFLVWSIANIFLNIKFIKSIVPFLGNYSLGILLFHCFFFKLVDIVQIKIYQMPWNKLISFPLINGQRNWWVIYCIIGIGGSVSFSLAIRKISSILHRNCK